MSVRIPHLVVLLLAVGSLGLASGSLAAPAKPKSLPAVVDPHGLTKSERSNAAAAVHLLEDSLTAHKPVAAANRYIANTYIQHNPNVDNGREAFVGFMKGFIASNPRVSIKVIRVVAQGNLVFTHSLLKTSPDDPGTIAADVQRFNSGGKAVEHWDVLQPVDKSTKSGNPQL